MTNWTTKEQVCEVRLLLADGVTRSELGRRSGVGRKAISDIKNKKTWLESGAAA